MSLRFVTYQNIRMVYSRLDDFVSCKFDQLILAVGHNIIFTCDNIHDPFSTTDDGISETLMTRTVLHG